MVFIYYSFIRIQLNNLKKKTPQQQQLKLVCDIKITFNMYLFTVGWIYFFFLHGHKFSSLPAFIAE